MTCKDCIHNEVCYRREVCNDIEEQIRELGCMDFIARADADRCVCCGEIVPEGRQICQQCERKRYIYTVPDIPPSLNKYAGRENVWAYRADKKQWEALCAVYCRPKPSETIKKCVVRITYFFRTRQRHDPDNYNGKFILDGLREAGIIEDDSFKNVELQLCGAYDKENPRTEIMIKEV